ncbi:hypothetical protein B0J11DRAFT_530317 [Dendryphion nanum]|uniref:ATP-dependent DNA helicase n=1 Tax=Dendryphion nanum TaxID=256645 RepID=A0A9P9DSV1_9PLEO|nr:hypothetical protein B0J11DRAFT_530317 [Dendryphion nanum]
MPLRAILSRVFLLRHDNPATTATGTWDEGEKTMDSDEDYGDFDDTAFLDAATQHDERNSATFPALPRSPKRRKISHGDNRTSTTAPRPRQERIARRGPFIDSDSDESAFDSVPTTGTRSRSLAKQSPSSKTTSNDDSEDAFEPAPTSKPASSRRASLLKAPGKENAGQENEDSPWKKLMAKKKKDRIHTPTADLDMTDMFFTQPPREHSPPWKPRGAIWQKPVEISIHRPDSMKTMALPGRRSIATRPVSRQSNPPLEEFGSPIEIDTLLEIEHVEPSAPLPTTHRTDDSFDAAQELADLPSDAFASSEEEDLVVVSERRTRIVAPQTGLRQTTLFGRPTVDGAIPQSQVNKRYNFVSTQQAEPPTHHKLDREALKKWVYPINLGEPRDYQFNIVARGLFHNLLVALPTGLGKTFIAATIMLNWYRWTTEAQIVFVAPTKPLVEQQVGACFGIAGIPHSDTTMLTGATKPAIRAEQWACKRVFFMTPQTLMMDFQGGYADPKKIVLLVIDEAHKATGEYAYTNIVRFMRRFNTSFRVLALTATPGADVQSVQKVISNLDISRIEIRTETSWDIRQFIHSRKVEKKVFGNSDEMELCMELYSKALEPCVKKLSGLNAFWSKDPLVVTPFGCTKARQEWMAQRGRTASMGEKSMVNAIFTVLATISQAMELLKFHGIRPFYVKLKEFRDDAEGSKSKYKNEIVKSKSFTELMSKLEFWNSMPDFVGHPKLEYLIEVILNHFANAADGAQQSETRIMVFAHFRDSAEDIVRVLKKHEPMIRPRVFVGQSSSKNSEGMLQKEQLDVVAQFKKGTFNTLVATSIGEEGLDIGEVDLIVCYDSKASPIRMLQRMGRTGRKRQGKIILLQMKGKEENDAQKAKDSYEKMQEIIAEGKEFEFHHDMSKRIVPADIQPAVEKKVIEIPLENSQPDFLPVPRKKGRAPKKPPKKFHMPDGVLTGFVTAGRMDQEILPKLRGKKKVFPSEELYPDPPQESVILNEGQVAELEKEFQTILDDGDDQPIIGALDLSKFPERQRVLSRAVHLVRPGRVTRNFVETFRRMHAVDDRRVAEIRTNYHLLSFDSEPDLDFVVSDGSGAEAAGVSVSAERAANDEAIWASDDPASQQAPVVKAKLGRKPKAKPAATKTTGPKAKASAKNPALTKDKPPTTKAAIPTKNSAGTKATTPKAAAPRGRPRKNPATVTPARQHHEDTPIRTPRFRASGSADEGASSSPPPTDPHMRLASQAIDLGSVDTDGEDEPQDTQAYRLDSDLVDFIAEDDEDVEVPDSSLPSLDLKGLGRGTQAVVRSAQPKKRQPMQKLFTSDVTIDDAAVSSDSDDEVPLVRSKVSRKAQKRTVAYISDSGSEVDSLDDDDDEPVIQPRNRARRVVQDDSDDDNDDE